MKKTEHITFQDTVYTGTKVNKICYSAYNEALGLGGLNNSCIVKTLIKK